VMSRFNSSAESKVFSVMIVSTPPARISKLLIHLKFYAMQVMEIEVTSDFIFDE
jgi:hypothetical protein